MSHLRERLSTATQISSASSSTTWTVRLRSPERWKPNGRTT